MLARLLRQRKGYALPFHVRLATPRTLTRCMAGCRAVSASSPLQGRTARILPAATGMFSVPTLVHQHRFVSSAYATSVPCERFDVDTTELARVMHNTALPSLANIFVMDLRKKRKTKTRPNSRKMMSTVIAAHRAASQKAAADGLAGDDDAYVPSPLVFVVKSSDTAKQAAHRQRTMEAYLQELNAAGEFFVCVLNAAQTRHWTRFIPTAHSSEAATTAATAAAAAAAGAAEGSASTPLNPAASSPPAATSEAVPEVGGDEEEKAAGEDDEEEWEEVEEEVEEEDGAEAESDTGGEAPKLPEDAPSADAEKAADRDAVVDASEAATKNDTHYVRDKNSPSEAHQSESTDSAAVAVRTDADPPLEEFDLDGAFTPADGDAATTASKSAAPDATVNAAVDPAFTAAAAAALDPVELASEATTNTTSTVATTSSAAVSDAAPPAPPTQTEKDEVAAEQPAAAAKTTASNATPTEPAEPTSREREGDEPTAADTVVGNTSSADAEVQERKKAAEVVPAAPLPQPTTSMPVFTDVPARLFNGASTSHLSDRARRELPLTANVLIIDHLDWAAEDSADLEAALAQVDPVVGHLLFYRDAYVLQSECTVKENHIFRDELVPFVFAFRTGLSKTAALAVQRRLVEAKRRRPAGLTAKQQAQLAGQHDRTFICVICAEESEVGGENPLEDPQARLKPATPSFSVQHEDVEEKSSEAGSHEVKTGEKSGEMSVEDETAGAKTSNKWQESTRAPPSSWLSKRAKKQDVASSSTQFDHDFSNNKVETSSASTTFHTDTNADAERDAPTTSSASPSPSLQLGLLSLDTMRFSHTPRRAYWTPHEAQRTVDETVEERAARAATEDPLQAAKEDHEGDDWGSTDGLSSSQDASTSESSTTSTTTSDAADLAKGRGGKRNGRKVKAASAHQTEADKKAAIAAVEAEAAAAEAALKAFMEKLCKGADTGAGGKGQHGASAKVAPARSKVKAKARNSSKKK